MTYRISTNKTWEDMKSMPTAPLISQTHQDPIARIALLVILASVLFAMFATPPVVVQSQPIIILPTQSLAPRLSDVGQDVPASMATLVPTQAAPTAQPTEVPAAQAVLEAVPTMAPQEPMVVYVEVTAEPPPPSEVEQATPLPEGTIIILPTAVQASDFAPPPDRCANPMLGALHCPATP